MQTVSCDQNQKKLSRTAAKQDAKRYIQPKRCHVPNTEH